MSFSFLFYADRADVVPETAAFTRIRERVPQFDDRRRSPEAAPVHALIFCRERGARGAKFHNGEAVPFRRLLSRFVSHIIFPFYYAALSAKYSA